MVASGVGRGVGRGVGVCVLVCVGAFHVHSKVHVYRKRKRNKSVSDQMKGE